MLANLVSKPAACIYFVYIVMWIALVNIVAVRSVAGNFVNKTAISVILFTKLPVRRKWKVVLTVPQPQT